jgi:hypothetical protein
MFLSFANYYLLSTAVITVGSRRWIVAIGQAPGKDRVVAQIVRRGDVMLDALLMMMLQGAAGEPTAPASEQPAEAQQTESAPATDTATSEAATEPQGRATRANQRACHITSITGSRVGRTARCMSQADHEVHQDAARAFTNSTNPPPQGRGG